MPTESVVPVPTKTATTGPPALAERDPTPAPAERATPASAGQSTKLPNPYVAPPPGITIPIPEELIGTICAKQTPRAGFPYPPGSPVFWIKYGSSVGWNEICAQVMAYEGLRALGSEARAPVCPGKTAGQCLAEALNDAEYDVAEERAATAVSLAMTELLRIPTEPGTRPAAASGSKIRNPGVFDGDAAPRHYEDVQQLEDHFNACGNPSHGFPHQWIPHLHMLQFLQLTKQPEQVRNLAREPLVFCQSDPYPDNFIIDSDDGHVTAINFSEVSILPASFTKYAVVDRRKAGKALRRGVQVHMAEGIDNVIAIAKVAGKYITSAYSYVVVGQSITGADEAAQTRFSELYCDWPEQDKYLQHVHHLFILVDLLHIDQDLLTDHRYIVILALGSRHKALVARTKPSERPETPGAEFQVKLD
ncbi:hypothetical protein C8A05DRAFT_37620 [Staphylotrichum tortipilum]|uniref:Aminoglycoside phosphotransferase domain-containing protein n=1 Tax=Staphylotrichum tortipilum TaxID=2831512 RepID=A0AAN6MDH5_9PEZI|nr:hypothetical protein C8A05DRAFT_37620 [Staphylotrichum longicolle]